jgi:protoporphyrinogen oxidase
VAEVNHSSEITSPQGVAEMNHSPEITSPQRVQKRQKTLPGITSTQEVSDTQPQTRQTTTGVRKMYDQYRTRFRLYTQISYAMMAIEPRPLPEEPRSYLKAINSQESVYWQASMRHEVNQLEEQRTWTIVPELPPGRKLIKGRWVNKRKMNPDNTIKEYKSRWVMKGFM